MRILYLANHSNYLADDEGGICHALTLLGHNVQRLREEAIGSAKLIGDVDFCLFHHYNNPEAIKHLKCKKVFWFFDLVKYDDPVCRERSRHRIQWMKDMTPLVEVGFCTDGEWVSKDTTGKLVWLTQGADERYAGFGQPYESKAKILFTGIGSKGGRLRSSFVEEMNSKYGLDFLHIDRGVYKEELRNLIASSEIVVAPDSPVTDCYWSNRIYSALGYGAFLIHPYCHGLTHHYKDAEHLVYYHDRKQLHYLIDVYLNNKHARESIAAAGLKHTLEHHTYRHRCTELIRVVQERLDL